MRTELGSPMAENKPDKWIQWVALTTTILAVCASIATLKSGGFSTKATLNATKANDQWAYYQAKSIKQHTCEVQRELMTAEKLIAANAAAVKFVERSLVACNQDIARYAGEKDGIKAQAEAHEKLAGFFQGRGAVMSVAVMLLQIAIMLSSVGAIIKRRELWLVGLALGLVGVGYMVRALTLVPPV